jgi:hypothetical protein
MLEGVRYRPTVKQIPTEANLRRAREHVKAIKERIRLDTFSFAEEFPDFLDLHKLINRSLGARAIKCSMSTSSNASHDLAHRYETSATPRSAGV